MTPPPANLLKSRLDVAEKLRIVTKGGAAVGRSANMPAWKAELTPDQIKSVVLYVQSLNVNYVATAVPSP